MVVCFYKTGPASLVNHYETGHPNNRNKDRDRVRFLPEVEELDRLKTGHLSVLSNVVVSFSPPGGNPRILQQAQLMMEYITTYQPLKEKENKLN
ncbi:hypothetical protein Hdeb2414_s0005g00179661 [Helianthus debilis subsp. tardiflorus]